MGKRNPTSVSEDRTVRGWIVVHGRAYVKLDQYRDGERSWNNLVRRRACIIQTGLKLIIQG
jgi:hypothetical protein